MTKRLVFDVEAIGLHGEGFAVGYVVMDKEGKVLIQGHAACPQEKAAGADSDREWVAQNVDTQDAVKLATPRDVRDWFWSVVQDVKSQGGEVWGDCVWPVEANFLSACVADDPENRKWAGPYPLYDVANVMQLAGFDPLATYTRELNELPIHNALNDARQSARQLMTALWMIGNK